MNKYILPFFFKITLQFGIGLWGLSLPLIFNNQAMFSGAVMKIQSDLSLLRKFKTFLILFLELFPEILFFKKKNLLVIFFDFIFLTKSVYIGINVK